MADFFLIFFTAVLILISAFIVLIILMQKPSANAGLGSALGGGAAESAFGAQTENILTKVTIYGCVAFFVCAFSLYLGFMATSQNHQSAFSGLESGLSEVVEPEAATDAAGGTGVTVSDVKVTEDGETKKLSTDEAAAAASSVVDVKPAAVEKIEEAKKAESEK